MAKSIFTIGYVTEAETTPGVFTSVIIERTLKGDLTRVSARKSEGDSVHGSLALVNAASVVADAYALNNFSAIKYIKWGGGVWSVSTTEVQRPRLILRMGEVYNGNSTPTA